MGIRKWNNPTGTPAYNSWKSMLSRIKGNSPSNKFYVTKGISVCDRWLNYDNFYEDMGDRPFNTTLDRIDGNGNYEPGNCRWASHRVQQNNKDSLTAIEHNKVTKTIGEWAFELCLSDRELSKAYKRYSKYGAKTFDEIFCKHLHSHRVNLRVNSCADCGTSSSIKWRAGLCNNCYARMARKRRNLKKMVQSNDN